MIRKKVGMAFMLACSWAVLLSADESDALGRIAREPSGGRLERLSHITLPFVANQGSSSTVAFWAGGLGGEVMVTPSGHDRSPPGPGLWRGSEDARSPPSRVWGLPGPG